MRAIFADIIKAVADRLTLPNKVFGFTGKPRGPPEPACISELGLLKHAVNEYKAAFPGDRRYNFIDWDRLVSTVDSSWPVISTPDYPRPFVEASINGLERLLRTEICQRGVRSAKLSGPLPLEASSGMKISDYISYAKAWLATGKGGVNGARSALISQGQTQLLTNGFAHTNSIGASAGLNGRFHKLVGRPATSSNMRPLRGGRRTRAKN